MVLLSVSPGQKFTGVPYKQQIRDYLKMGLNLAAIMKIINPQLDKSITYNSYRYFVQRDEDLFRAWQSQQ